MQGKAADVRKEERSKGVTIRRNERWRENAQAELRGDTSMSYTVHVGGFFRG